MELLTEERMKIFEIRLEDRQPFGRDIQLTKSFARVASPGAYRDQESPAFEFDPRDVDVAGGITVRDFASGGNLSPAAKHGGPCLIAHSLFPLHRDPNCFQFFKGGVSTMVIRDEHEDGIVAREWELEEIKLVFVGECGRLKHDFVEVLRELSR